MRPELSQEELEFSRRFLWDTTRTFAHEKTRETLQALLSKVREVRAVNVAAPLTAGEWTDLEAPFADLAEEVLDMATARDLYRLLVLLALEASGANVNLGLEINHG